MDYDAPVAVPALALASGSQRIVVSCFATASSTSGPRKDLSQTSTFENDENATPTQIDWQETHEKSHVSSDVEKRNNDKITIEC